MRRICIALTALLVLSGFTGCGAINCMEQWKCDHLGWCHFGRQRSLPPYPTGVPTPYATAPNSGYQAPVYPPATVPTQVTPPPVYQTPINPAPVYPPAGNCNSCQKRPY